QTDIVVRWCPCRFFPAIRPGSEFGRREAALFDRVLVPLDESALAEQVLPHVVVTARHGDKSITLLRVLEPPTSAGVEQPTDPVEWQLALDGAHSYLAGVQRRLAEVGVKVDIDVIEGDPATSILQHMHDK